MKISRRFVLDAVAVSGAVVGSALVASNSNTNAIGYTLFLFSSVASVIILRSANGPKSIMYLNCYFTLINIFGFIRYTFF